MENRNVTMTSYVFIGIMLFALFFGAGNLIFPATLGQHAGMNVGIALLGFLITGIGLPFVGIMAIGVSKSDSLQQLASKVHPIYGVLFTALLYLTIGPFFAIPRTGAVAYEIGIVPFIGDGAGTLALLLFTFLFFVATLWLSLSPGKLVDRIGKWMAPVIIALIFILIVLSLLKPMGSLQNPQGTYMDGAFLKGFLEGYNTMDALASLVFGIVVIKAIRDLGITTGKGILLTTMKSSLLAVLLLGGIYSGIAYIGATSVEKYGIFDTGGPILSHAFAHYFGSFGMVVLAIVIILACLTTSVGLIVACSEYFEQLFPKVGYKSFVFFFTIFSFIIANFGLSKIISYSIPMLMFLYPLAIVLMILAFLSPVIHSSRFVFFTTIFVTFAVSIIDGLKALCKSLHLEYFDWLEAVMSFYNRILPFYEAGLGWLVPAMITMIFTTMIVKIQDVRIERKVINKI
ncbi:branched-chain amino acid transport system II carrier protein [Fervidibacillus halotolerans]|uniref:Branched-chain amino acid transport system carrier protein n=1 Tax=Fervidibacillus halotolerans TaxID=2980027 RepID=A0A9E8M0F2_9BACI|nr:branched-chain amino acid transport system II carrier protein [Fervidibacillus halotolerans]WAA13105.1 branched-chain amino acid transport system II carrier protein [Fervidibacillus halotolerans]